MQINQLIHFVTVVENLSFTKAAKELHIAQPSLSTSIKRLEEELGFALINRASKRISLTAEGTALFNDIKKFINHHEFIKDSAHMIKTEGTHTFSLGIIESVKSWFPEIIKQFRKTHPNMQMRIKHLLSENDIKNALSNYDVNLAITNQFISDSQVTHIPLYEESFVLAIPRSHELNKKENIVLEDLENLPLIISRDGHQSRREIFNAFSKYGLKPNITYELERFELTQELIKANVGISIMPEMYTKTMDSEISIRNIKNFNIKRTVFLVFDHSVHMQPATKDFMNSVLLYFDHPFIN